MKRYYLHTFVLDETILIDTVDRTWTFYKTNIYGQFYNLDQKPQKVSGQRIAGLKKRLDRGSSADGYVVDSFIYQYFFTDEQRQADPHFRLNKELIASSNSLFEILTIMCKDLLAKRDNAQYVKADYYEKIINERVLLEANTSTATLSYEKQLSLNSKGEN